MNKNCFTCIYEPKWYDGRSPMLGYGWSKLGQCQIDLPPYCTKPTIWICNESQDNNGLKIGTKVMPPCPAYVEDYVKAMDAVAKEESASRVAKKVPVNIYYNDESGDWKWSVADANDPEFWIDSFETEQEAIDFCEKNGLSIVEVIK